MSLTESRREMFDIIATALAAADTSDLPTVVTHFEGRDMGEKDPLKAYLESYIRPNFEPQASLADHQGVRRWETSGTLWFQCFGPLSGGRGLEIAEKLATIAKLAYQGKSSENCIWFRNIRLQYLGASGGWYQINVLVDYEYDEVR